MAYNPEEDIKVNDLPEKTTDVVWDDKLLVIDSEDANILKQVDASKVWWWWWWSWYTKAETDALLNAKQDTLESWTNIKTINWNSILWPWNIVIQGGWTVTVDDALSNTSENPVQNKVINTALQNKQDTLVSGTNIKTVNNQSLLGGGDITIQGGWWYQVFALTGSYWSEASQLNDTDYQTYLQAVEYLNNWWLALLSWMWDWYFYPYYNSWNYSWFIKSGYRDINQSTWTIILYKGSSAIVYIEKKIIARKWWFQQWNNICIDDIALTSWNRDYKFTMRNWASDIENYVMLFWIKIERTPSGGSSVYLEDEVAWMIVWEWLLGNQNFVVWNTFSSSYEYNNQTKYWIITVNPMLSWWVWEKTIRFTLNKSISDADTKAYFNFILIST